MSSSSTVSSPTCILEVQIPRHESREESYFTKRISIYKSEDQSSEMDDYERYQSSAFGRIKMDHMNTMEDVIGLISKSENIILLSGAGISCTAGIPDFRSENGLYAQIKEQFPNLTQPESMFDQMQFLEDPNVFYSFANSICPGFDEQSITFYPTPTHWFIKLLESKGKLLQNYTQNIDNLETLAGIQNVTQCHGSFATASCVNCEYQITGKCIGSHLREKRIPLCPYCRPSESDLKVIKLSNDSNDSNQTQLRSNQPILEKFDALNGVLRIRIPGVLGKKVHLIHELCPILFRFDDDTLKIKIFEPGTVPDTEQCAVLEVMSKCGDFKLLEQCMTVLLSNLKRLDSFGVMKPDITFFHQELSTSYHELIAQHIKTCDLLIVMGTSLNVMPVSIIPSKLNHVPAILINREIPRQIIKDQFDVYLLGNCDDICQTIIQKLGWKCIAPKRKENGGGDMGNSEVDDDAVQSFLEQKEDVGNDDDDNDYQQNAGGGIAVEMIDAQPTEYEFVAPNYHIFPNGVPPEEDQSDDDQFENVLHGEEDSDGSNSLNSESDFIANNVNNAAKSATQSEWNRKRKLSEIAPMDDDDALLCTQNGSVKKKKKRKLDDAGNDDDCRSGSVSVPNMAENG